MNTLRQLRNFWMLWIATIALACSSNAVAQASYKVADQGTLGDDLFGMVMGLNHQGWTENMDGNATPPITSTSTTLLNGRAVVNVGGRNIDLGTLGGKNSWINYGGINDRGDAVGMAETAVPDPNGEDMCGFHTKLTCRPFFWRDGRMTALPTLGGNNGQASAINNRGQIVGLSETTAPDPSCPQGKTAVTQLPVLWEKGEAHALPTLAGEPDGFVQGINDQGQAVGSTGTCTNIQGHAVLWKDGTVIQLPDIGRAGGDAYAINDHGQVAGFVPTPDGSTIVATLWQNGGVTNLGILPGDHAAFATGVNNRGQVVGSTFDSTWSWDHGFIWQDGVMTDLNSLIPKESNLFIIAASNINDRGQISGMATVMSGPDKGKVHAILLTPTNDKVGTSVADVAPVRPVSANACHHARRLGMPGIGE